MSALATIHQGKRSETCRAFQAALNRRLLARDLDGHAVTEDGVCGPLTLDAARTGAWALGALKSTHERIARQGEIPVGVQRMVLNPGRRSPEQKSRGKARVAALRHDQAAARRAASGLDAHRTEVVRLCQQAAANYRANPGAYHYLAGGKANLEFLRPTPRDWRSDCSQFASSVQDAAGGKPLARAGALWVATSNMDGYLEPTTRVQPGDFGMYGPPGRTHHVEVVVAASGGRATAFIGHGSPPIDGLTPGLPTFYLANPGRR